MPFARFHFLDARNQFNGLRPWLDDRLEYACDAASNFLEFEPIDIVVNTGPYVIPEKGHVGQAWPDTIYITVDPSNPALKVNDQKSLERMLVHKLHHAARWSGPGCGASLGEQIVTEGLAGHFVQEVFGGSPEPWESMELSEVRSYAASASENWFRLDHDRGEWFFGEGKLPRWLGYSLGFQIVAQYLSQNATQRPSSLAHVSASNFRDIVKLI